MNGQYAQSYGNYESLPGIMESFMNPNYKSPLKAGLGLALAGSPIEGFLNSLGDKKPVAPSDYSKVPYAPPDYSLNGQPTYTSNFSINAKPQSGFQGFDDIENKIHQAFTPEGF
jgi:hypothetical protein